MCKKKTHEEFLEELYEKNTHFRRGIFKVIGEYKTAKTKIQVEDEFGICEITPNSLLSRGVRCELRSAINKTDYFINRAKKVHGDKYSYKNLIYIEIKKKGLLTCKEHGDFEQILDNHLQGEGCQLCAQKERTNKQKTTINDFLNKAYNVHGDRYNYSLVKNIENNSTKIEIICDEHGKFKQPLGSHLMGRGCYKCGQKTMGGFGGYCTTMAERNKKEWLEKKCYLYLVKLFNEQEIFYKIGLTIHENILKRFHDVPYKKSVIEKMEGNLYDLIFREKFFLNKFKDSNYKPKLYFKGHTECFNKQILEKLNTIKNEI